MRIRAATGADLEAITAIYAHHVLNGTGTFEEVPPTQAEMAERMAAVKARGFTWFVAEDEDGTVLGYAYSGPFRARSAYRFTTEDSVYVRVDAQGRGVGRALLSAVVEECAAKGLKQMLALIGDSQNMASIALHQTMGFEPSGVMRNVGFKAGRWLDVVVMQRAL